MPNNTQQNLDRFKFRAWDIHSKKILNWKYLFSFKSVCELFDNSYLVLMQSTGLKDKNGVLIYEGDILEVVSYGVTEEKLQSGNNRPHLERWVVKWFQKDTAFIITKGTFYTNLNPNPMVTKDGHILGNIHQNPELLS